MSAGRGWFGVTYVCVPAMPCDCDAGFMARANSPQLAQRPEILAPGWSIELTRAGEFI